MPSDNEQMYDTLQKAVNNSVWIIKWMIYPITGIFVVLTAVGIWYGVDIRSTANDIETIKKDLEIRSREIKVTSNELEYQAREDFDKLHDQSTVLESNIQSIEAEYKSLQGKYKSALERNDALFNELNVNNRSLSEFSDKIKETTESYAKLIELANQGAEQRKNDVELILSKRNEQLEAVQTSTVLLLEYLVLMQSRSNTIPNPNIQKGIGILNRILVILVPDEKERSAIVGRINKTIEGK